MYDRPRIYIVEGYESRIFSRYLAWRDFMLQQSKNQLIHFEMPWEFVGKSTNYTKVRAMHRLYTKLHKTILGFADIGLMEKLFWFFSVSPLIHVKLKKKYSRVSYIYIKY
jgi:hypothetical protein